MVWREVYGVFENFSSGNGSPPLSHRFLLYFFSAAAFSRSKQQECVSGKTHAVFARERFDASKEGCIPDGESCISAILFLISAILTPFSAILPRFSAILL